MAATDLTPRQIKLVHYLMKGYNQKRALIEAGYSETTATTKSAQVINQPAVRAELKRRQARMRKKYNLSAEWIVERLMKIADASLGEALEFDDEGNLRWNWDKMTPEFRYALTGIKTREYKEGRGKNAEGISEIKPEMADKLRALELLGKYLGLWKEKIEVSAEDDLIKRLRSGWNRVGQEGEVDAPDDGPETSERD